MTIGNVEHKCANCVNWCRSLHSPLNHCRLHEGVSVGCNDSCNDFSAIKFKDLVPATKDLIHKYLDKLKEEGLIDHYETQTIYRYRDGKPSGTNISLYKGEYVYSHSFYDLNDENIVIEILAGGIVNLYLRMANDIMEKIKEDK